MYCFGINAALSKWQGTKLCYRGLALMETQDFHLSPLMAVKEHIETTQASK